MKEFKFSNLVFIAGLIIPIIFIFLFPNAYHHWDVGTFIKWNEFSDSFSKLYATDCLCNYPWLGLLFSSGILRFFESNITYFRLFLSLFDIASVILIYFILKNLDITNAKFWAGIVGILPSSWIGTSFWGQIDNVGQVLILLFFLAILLAYKRHTFILQKYINVFIGCMGFIFCAIILTKQISYFSLVSMSFIVLYVIYISNSSTKGIIKSLAIFIAAIILPIIVIDLSIAIESKYFSHLERVLLTGSDHMNELSGRGFNIWMLLNRDMGSSSDIAFYKSLTPKIAGLIAFAIFVIYITVLLFIKIKKQKQLTDSVFISFIFHTLLVNLGFNILLTGTHERYLIHFYPYLFILLLYFRKSSNGILNIAIYGAFIYGLFVLQILLKHQYMGGYLIVGLFHLLLLIQLLVLYTKELIIVTD